MGNCYNRGNPLLWGELGVGIPPIPTMKSIPTMCMTPLYPTLFTMGSDGYFSSFSTIGAGIFTRIGLSFY